MQIPARRILVVDDEPNVLMTVQAILSAEGYETEGRAAGGAAIEAVQNHYYDLVLTDLKMPDVDGLAVLAAVRKFSPETVTVMMTGYGSVSSAIDAVQLGAYEYLLKPVEVPELKAAVRRALDRKRLSEVDTLYSITQKLSTSLDRTVISGAVCDAVRRVLSLSGARLITYERDGSLGCDDSPAALLCDALREDSVKDRLLQREIVTFTNANQAITAWAASDRLASFALVPGVVEDRVVCVLSVDNGTEHYEFHASALRFLTALANQAAVRLENASLVAELKKNNEEIAVANKKLRELDKLKSQFLGVATHELRTPLSVILGYNAMLSESLQDRLNEDERQTLAESMKACRRLIGLVNSMLDLSQIESGKMRMNFADGDIREVVQGVVALFRYDADRKKIRLTAKIGSDIPPIRMDSERIQQVVTNLVANALKFTDRGGSISVIARFRPESQNVELSVTDTGLGIAPEHQASIFDEFANAQRRASRANQGGFGLGLAIVRRIVMAHKGTVSVNSTPNKGSTFTISLPIHPTAARTAMSA